MALYGVLFPQSAFSFYLKVQNSTMPIEDFMKLEICLKYLHTITKHHLAKKTLKILFLILNLKASKNFKMKISINKNKINQNYTGLIRELLQMKIYKKKWRSLMIRWETTTKTLPPTILAQ